MKKQAELQQPDGVAPRNPFVLIYLLISSFGYLGTLVIWISSLGASALFWKSSSAVLSWIWWLLLLSYPVVLGTSQVLVWLRFRAGSYKTAIFLSLVPLANAALAALAYLLKILLS